MHSISRRTGVRAPPVYEGRRMHKLGEARIAGNSAEKGCWTVQDVVDVNVGEDVAWKILAA